MISLDIVLTGLIVAAAAAWAGRSLWRTLRRRFGNAPTTPGCGGPSGSCGNCPVGENGAATTDRNSTTCESDRLDES